MKHYFRTNMIRLFGISIISLFVMCVFVSHSVQAKNKNVYKKVTVEQDNGNTNQIKIWKVPQTETNIYNYSYQKKAKQFITVKKSKGKHTMAKPLLILNPYGTFSTSIYFYAKTPVKCYVKCTIQADGAETITRVLKNKNKCSRNQEYLISHLVAGSDNTVTLEFYDTEHTLIKKIIFTVEMKADTDIPAIQDIQQGTNTTEEVSDGLYAMIGHDRYIKSNVYFYDNNGVNHGKLPLYNYRADRLITVSGKLIYPMSSRKFAIVNRLGRVVKKIYLGQYKMHHDFLYDKSTKKLICLVSKDGKETIEDDIISVNIKTGKKSLLVDWEELMPDVRAQVIWDSNSINTYGGTELDWIHLNSLDLVNNGEIVVSSREQSTIIKVSDLYGTPTVDYLIHDGALYNDTIFSSLDLTKKGDFTAQCGQHTITVEKDDSLPEGQYYLYMFNNNFAFSYTLPFYDWRSFFPTAGNFSDDPHSYYYKYLVDEDVRTYELVQYIELPYSRLVSGVQQYKNHITFGSGFAHQYGEYDFQGNLIRMFTYEGEKYSFRVTKYDFVEYFYRE